MGFFERLRRWASNEVSIQSRKLDYPMDLLLDDELEARADPGPVQVHSDGDVSIYVAIRIRADQLPSWAKP